MSSYFYMNWEKINSHEIYESNKIQQIINISMQLIFQFLQPMSFRAFHHC